MAFKKTSWRASAEASNVLKLVLVLLYASFT